MIANAIADVADVRPDHLALIDQRNRRLTFGQLVETVDSVASSFAELGLESGSVVALYEPNRVEWLIAMLAAAQVGAKAIGLNTRFRTAELEYLLHVARVDAVLAPDRFLGVRPAELLAGVTESPRVLVDGDPSEFHDRFEAVAWSELENGQRGASARLDLDDHDWCGFTTSGTTGHPKLAVHTQAGTLHHCRAVIDAFDLGPETVALVPLPLCGVFGFTTALTTLLAGGTTVVHETFDPAAVAVAMIEHEVTFFNGADDMISAVLDQPSFDGASTTWTSGVYADFTNTGAAVAARAEAVTDGRLRLSGVYGSSEGFAFMSRWPSEAPISERAVNGGRLVSPELDVRCVDPASGKILDHGQPGEICFRGPGMINAYLEHPDAPETAKANASAFTDDGWFRTGDLGHTTDERAFVYNARLGDSLRLRGFLCDPTEIEHHLEQHPSVDLAQVVGVERPGGQVAVAFVRLTGSTKASHAGGPGASGMDTNDPHAKNPRAIDRAEELRRHCIDGLANYKTPDRVVIIDDFPVTDGPNGTKIRKVDLRQRAEALYSRRESSHA